MAVGGVAAQIELRAEHLHGGGPCVYDERAVGITRHREVGLARERHVALPAIEALGVVLHARVGVEPHRGAVGQGGRGPLSRARGYGHRRAGHAAVGIEPCRGGKHHYCGACGRSPYHETPSPAAVAYACQHALLDVGHIGIGRHLFVHGAVPVLPHLRSHLVVAHAIDTPTLVLQFFNSHIRWSFIVRNEDSLPSDT